MLTLAIVADGTTTEQGGKTKVHCREGWRRLQSISECKGDAGRARRGGGELTGVFPSAHVF
jgi:hypothetical protein